MKTNWELLEFNQKLMDAAIEEFTKVDPDWNKYQELAEWINQQPYPYEPKNEIETIIPCMIPPSVEKMFEYYHKSLEDVKIDVKFDLD